VFSVSHLGSEDLQEVAEIATTGEVTLAPVSAIDNSSISVPKVVF
jgi:hypothetical protein